MTEGKILKTAITREVSEFEGSHTTPSARDRLEQSSGRWVPHLLTHATKASRKSMACSLAQLERPATFPDMALSDYWLFHSMK